MDVKRCICEEVWVCVYVDYTFNSTTELRFFPTELPVFSIELPVYRALKMDLPFRKMDLPFFFVNYQAHSGRIFSPYYMELPVSVLSVFSIREKIYILYI